MSLKTYTNIIEGVVFEKGQFPLSVWDEKLLPYIEGHDDRQYPTIFILTPGEASHGKMAVGVVKASVGPYEDARVEGVAFDTSGPEGFRLVDDFCERVLGFDISPMDYGLWLYQGVW